MTGEYKGDREYTGLSDFVEKEAADYRKRKGVSNVGHPSAENAKPAVTAGPKAEIGGPLVDAGIAPNAPAPAPAPAPASPAPGPAAPEAKPAPPPPPPKEAPPAPAPPPPPPVGPNPHGVVLKFGKDEIVKDLPSFKHFLSKEGSKDSTFVKCECRLVVGSDKIVSIRASSSPQSTPLGVRTAKPWHQHL